MKFNWHFIIDRIYTGSCNKDAQIAATGENVVAISTTIMDGFGRNHHY